MCPSKGTNAGNDLSCDEGYIHATATYSTQAPWVCERKGIARHDIAVLSLLKGHVELIPISHSGSVSICDSG